MSNKVKIELDPTKSPDKMFKISWQNVTAEGRSLQEVMQIFDDKIERRVRLGFKEAEKQAKLLDHPETGEDTADYEKEYDRLSKNKKKG